MTAALRITMLLGSWKFIFFQLAVLISWISYNSLSLSAFDAPPFILLNLFLSCLAAFTASLVIMSSSSQYEADKQVNIYIQNKIDLIVEKIISIEEQVTKQDQEKQQCYQTYKDQVGQEMILLDLKDNLN